MKDVVSFDSNCEAMETKSVKRPNIVLIVADDLGYGDVRCYWPTEVRTPVLDSLSEKGIKFIDFNVCPLCAPTRSAFMTGLYSMENGMWRGPTNKHDPDDKNYRGIKAGIALLPELMKQEGYKTAIYGKWHLGYTSPDVPNDRGFDDFVGFLGGSNSYDQVTGGKNILHNTKPYTKKYEHTTDLFTDHAVEFIKQNQDNPFFLYVPYNAVHGPLWSPNRQKFSAKREWLEKYADLPEDRRDYCATIEHLDHSVGRLLQTIEDCGLQDNTLIVFMSDNGACLTNGETKGVYPGCNGPFRAGKGSTYNGGITVPMMMMWPGTIPAGSVSIDMALHVDLFSTLIDVAGLPIPETNGGRKLRGMSLMSHIKSGGQEKLPERLHFWELVGKFAARKGEWKLVGETDSTHADYALTAEKVRNNQFELYNLIEDVGERNDLIEQSKQKHDELRNALLEFFESIAE